MQKEEKEQECISYGMFKTSSYFPQSHLWDFQLVPEKEKGKTEKSELLEKAGISLGVVRAEKRLSTSLLVLADTDLWFWPQSGFLSLCFWKTWQEFNLKCGLWMALVWSKSEGTMSSQLRSLRKWGQSHDIMTSLALAYRLSLVHQRL